MTYTISTRHMWSRNKLLLSLAISAILPLKAGAQIVSTQAETVVSKTDYHVVGKQVFIGSAVTTGKPEGDVTILRGSTVISNHGTVNIPSGFEVKKGAQFEIITTNH